MAFCILIAIWRLLPWKPGALERGVHEGLMYDHFCLVEVYPLCSTSYILVHLELALSGNTSGPVLLDGVSDDSSQYSGMPPALSWCWRLDFLLARGSW